MPTERIAALFRTALCLVRARSLRACPILLATLSLLPALSFLSILGLLSTLGAQPARADGPTIPMTRTAGADWPSFLGIGRDARSTEAGILKTWPANGPRLVWDMPLGEGYASVSVADGRLFVFDREGDTARLTAVASETGTQLWRQTYPTTYEDMYGYSGGPRAVPVIDGDRVYIFGVEGRLRAHKVTDGSLLWEIDTHEHYGVQQNFFGAGSTPIIEGPLLIVPIGGSPSDSPGIKTGEARGNGTGIVAFDKMTGTERYRLSDELASYASPVITTIGDRRWGFHFARGGLIGFEPTRGKLDFHFPWRAKILESVNAATPVVSSDLVFISETYGPGSALLRVTAEGPQIVWKDERRDQRLLSHWATPVLHEGHLYGVSGRGSGDAELRCIVLETGEIRWREKLPGRSSMLLADGHLVLLAEYGELWLVEANAERFRKVAEAKPADPDGKPLLRHPAWNAPVLSHGLLYLRGKDRLIALELIPTEKRDTSPAP